MLNDFQLVRLTAAELPEFKREMQRAFQRGYEEVFGPCPKPVLPAADIDRSLNAEGAVAYVARVNGMLAGGAVVRLDARNRTHQLELLFVRTGSQSRGVGQAIWQELEARHADAVSWETFTPCFERRNLHFYINCCGFQVVEYYHPGHPLPEDPDRSETGMAPEAAQYFFRFRKVKTPASGAETAAQAPQ